MTLRAPWSSQRDGRLDVADAAAHAAGEARQQTLDQGGVAALAHRGVEVDDRDLAGEREALGDRPGSPASIAFSAPPTSWTVWPPWRSMLGTITAAP